MNKIDFIADTNEWIQKNSSAFKLLYFTFLLGHFGLIQNINKYSVSNKKWQILRGRILVASLKRIKIRKKFRINFVCWGNFLFETLLFFDYLLRYCSIKKIKPLRIICKKCMYSIITFSCMSIKPDNYPHEDKHSLDNDCTL